MYRPTTGQWFIYAGGSGHNITLPVTFPIGSSPAPGDYDGVGKAEAAVYDPTTSEWIVLAPGATATHVFARFGGLGDIPVPGAYDLLMTHSQALEAAVWRPSTGQFFIQGPNGNRILQFAVGDIPAPGDYDGTGQTEAAVYRPSTGRWLVVGPTDTAPRVFATYGGPADIPTASPYPFRALKGGGSISGFGVGVPVPVNLAPESSSAPPLTVASTETSAPTTPPGPMRRTPSSASLSKWSGFSHLSTYQAIRPSALKDHDSLRRGLGPKRTHRLPR